MEKIKSGIICVVKKHRKRSQKPISKKCSNDKKVLIRQFKKCSFDKKVLKRQIP